MARRAWALIVLGAASCAVAVALSTGAGPTASAAGAPPRDLPPLARRDFVRTVRVTGTTEAVRSLLLTTPRLAGATGGMLVITRIAPPGTAVKTGDVLVEFDRQSQENAAFDRRAEYQELVEQIAKTRAEQEAERARHESEFEQTVNLVASLELEVLKNEMVSRNQALENDQKLEAARAKAKALRQNLPLRREAAEAGLRILEIRRDRAQRAMEHARRNAEAMVIRSPMDGLVVAKMTWKGNGPGDVGEGDQVWPGAPILEVVNVEAMRVRARVNQADIVHIRPGQPVTVRLDAYDDFAIRGRVEHMGPLATAGSFSARVRTFTMLVSIEGSNPRLMPDLTAAVDVEVERVKDALVVPREAIHSEGDSASVRVRAAGSSERRAVTLGSRNETEVVVTGGLGPGDVVLP
jgi:multidrug efflux pump subunit AcrA (membrane-fusion protein)